MEATLEVVKETRNPELYAKIQKIKARIKALSEDQKRVKTLLRGDHRTIKERGAKMDAPWLQEECYNRAMQITALLNLYSEMRGKEARHSTKRFNVNSYYFALRNLKMEFGIDQ